MDILAVNAQQFQSSLQIGQERWRSTHVIGCTFPIGNHLLHILGCDAACDIIARVCGIGLAVRNMALHGGGQFMSQSG